MPSAKLGAKWIANPVPLKTPATWGLSEIWDVTTIIGQTTWLFAYISDMKFKGGLAFFAFGAFVFSGAIQNYCAGILPGRIG
jgi:hypothetical protein